ncbi:hypothetical protein Q6247_26265, partial [Klebsiella pneumoniae]
ALAVRERAAYWKQRGKFRAIREGDANTGFFHAQATQRLRRNNIRTGHLQALLRARAVDATAVDLDVLYASKEKIDPAPLISPFTLA